MTGDLKHEGALDAMTVARIRRLSAPKELDVGEEGGELNVVPFLDIVMNIIIFVLASLAVVFTATIDVAPPTSPQLVTDRITKPSLSVLIVEDGFAIKSTGGNVASGCGGIGSGLAVPTVNGQYDLGGLTRCLARLKAASSDLADQNQISLSANPGVDYRTVVAATDAARTDLRGALLFPDVVFQVPR